MKKIYFLIAFLTTFYLQAQIVNIPDINFKAALLAASSSNITASIQTPNSNGSVSSYNKIDTNDDGEIQVSEANLIKYLKVSNLNITDLDGINSFTNLNRLICNYNQLTSLNVSGLTNLIFLNCDNNQLTSLNVSSLTNLTNLNCRVNSLPTLNITNLTSLINLLCDNNQLTNLNINGLTNLQRLYTNNNQLPSLNVSGLNSLIYLNCAFNQLPSLNISGLTNLQELHCNNNQLPNLDTSGLVNLDILKCYFNEISNLNLNGLSNLTYLDCSNNQLISLNTNNLTLLEFIYCNHNQLTSINTSGLTSLTFLMCYNNQLTSLDINNLTSLSILNCSTNQLNTLFIKNNIQTSSLEFLNNPNLQYICADQEELSLVQDLIDSYGYTSTCHVNSYCSFTPGGVFYTINGTNKLDENTNGCDINDNVFPNLKYTITDGFISGNFISDISGNYSFSAQSGSHTITPVFENPNYFNVSPTNVTVTFPTATSPFTQNFCITPIGIHHDLEVVIIPLQPARPGFNATYKIKYKNKGIMPETTNLVFYYNDFVLDYISSSLAPTVQSTGSISWNIGILNSFQSGEFILTLNVNSPTETPAVNSGDILNYTAVFNGLNTDETPIDNTFLLNQTVVNSYDPNDKTCLEGNTINPSMIGEYVHYKIRFENTGTFPAQNIVVKDMIDTAKFDISTLQMTDASHSCVTRISSPNKVEFIFENINLPFDDATNDGYVAFKIKTKNTLVVGNTISNSANIYFDYNFPIVTNTATSTFQVLQNDSFVFDNYFSVYPNPAKEVLNLKTKQDVTVYSLSIYSILGQQVQTITNPEQTIDVSNLKIGNYFIKIVTDKGISSSKFIKE